MSTTEKLTIRLPREDAEFLRRYARAHRLTITEVIDRHLRRMRTLEVEQLSPELDAITGLVPSDIDTESVYKDHLSQKHHT